MKLKNKKVLVLGLGDSGRAVIKVLQQKGAFVNFYDDNLKYYDYVGFVRNPLEKKYDLVVLSPGIKIKGNVLVEELKKRKTEIISELDFAYLLHKGKIVAVTGTNGKTTVCMLVNKILKEACYKTFLCGNIGLPFSSVCLKTTKESVSVCEVSSFQLEGSKFFRADVNAILNIKPDHLDRHGTFEEYVAAKAKIASHLKRNDLLVLNLDDEMSKKQLLHKKYQFFSKKMLKKGVFIWKNQIFVNKKGVLNLNEIPLKGEKNLENVLAAVAICSHFKVSPASFSRAIKSFVPASHRMEKVGEINGVTYIDDSKATNVASTLACIEAFKDKSIILLLGGKGKNIDYDEIFSSNVKFKQVVCFGQDGQKIKENAENFTKNCCFFEKFALAVEFCKNFAISGDYVLLSPACASFDEFSGYEERGDKFKNLILGNSYEN